MKNNTLTIQLDFKMDETVEEIKTRSDAQCKELYPDYEVVERKISLAYDLKVIYTLELKS